MKFFILIVIILVVAALSNPDRTQHNLALREALERLDKENNGFLEHCDFFDFQVFSMVRYMDATVSVGFFGHVFVQYDELEGSMQYFDKRRHTQRNLNSSTSPPFGFNIGR
ncbi:MAG TPA: hypothetical protein PLO67_15810 [Saprospiraceae bacterium]|nr:hypothetical protein [Saprospiraceae bacterium]HPI07786.1 hypothetical protein [Saprospiraceae bacterium]